MVALLEPGTAVAGVFTRSRTPGAPVDWCRGSWPHGKARAIVVNAGNANAFTGRPGADAVARRPRRWPSSSAARRARSIMASTGVIGEPLPDEKITAGCPERQARSPRTAGRDAARAIMTTDTFPKGSPRAAPRSTASDGDASTASPRARA